MTTAVIITLAAAWIFAEIRSVIHHRDADEAREALERELLRHFDTAVDRDRFATALRGELTRQARAELVAPDEPCGTVLTFQRSGGAS